MSNEAATDGACSPHEINDSLAITINVKHFHLFILGNAHSFINSKGVSHAINLPKIYLNQLLKKILFNLKYGNILTGIKGV